MQKSYLFSSEGSTLHITFMFKKNFVLIELIYYITIVWQVSIKYLIAEIVSNKNA